VPSCFQGDTTWDQDNIYSVLVDFDNPEECQETCQADPACVGFTWTTENSDVIPLACILFSELGQETPCQNCVSGPPECRCSIAGECEATGENVLDVVSEASSIPIISFLSISFPFHFFDVVSEPLPILSFLKLIVPQADLCPLQGD